MKFCSYCSQEARYKLKNGKWCCSKSANSCLVNRQKNSSANKGRKLGPQTEEHKRKSAESRKGLVPWNVGKKTGHQSREIVEKRIKPLRGRKCKPRSVEAKLKQSKTLKKPEIKEKKSKSQIEAWKDPQKRKNMLDGLNKPELIEKRREDMLNGRAVYIKQFLKNPSKPQLELFKMLQQLCPNPIMNYPIYYRKKWNYSIDIADPRLGLAFEYDEPYWHKHKGRDLLRQKRIEELGWKFLRYEKLPSLEQVKQDINQKLSEKQWKEKI